MRLILDDTQQFLQDGARRFLEKEVQRDVVREVEASTDGFLGKQWSRIAELGWSSVAIPESYSGGGRGLVDLCVVAEECGRAAASFPLAECSGFAARVLGAPRAGDYAGPLLTSVATKGAVVTAALVEEAGRSERTPASMVIDEGARNVINGTKMLVPFASVATVMLVSLRSSTGEPVIVAVDANAEGLGLVRHHTTGGAPLFAAHFDGVEVESEAILFRGDDAISVLGAATDVATVVSMADVVGLCEGILEITTQHAKTRSQFGRQIGTFQAVSHSVADMRIQIDAIRLLTMEAAWMLDQGVAATMEIASAKAFANDAVTKIVADGQRINGAIGFSNEYDLQLYTRRARAFCLSYGDTAEQTERAATALGL